MSWKTVRLGDIATFANGYPFKPTDRSNSGLPIIRIQDLTGNSYEKNLYDGNLPNKYSIKNGDILISWSGSLGVYEWQNGNAWLNQHIFKVIFDKEELDKAFFKYLIIEKLTEMKSMVHGATMQHITKSKFDNIPVSLPSLAEQKRIAAILDQADELRQKDRQLLQHYDQLIQSTFLEMFGNSLLEGKYLRALGSVAKSGKGTFTNGPFGSDLLTSELKKEGVPVVYIRDIRNGKYDRVSTVFVEHNKADSLPNCQILPGDLLITKVGDPPGTAAIYPDGEPMGIITQDVVKLRVNENEVIPQYLQYYFNPLCGLKGQSMFKEI